MNYTKQLFITIIALCLFVCGAAAGLAQTSEFSYQGRLSESSAPADGQYDLEFRLFDVSTGSAPLAAIQRANVTVTNGIFSVRLDFGANAFNGSPRFLEIGVRPAGAGVFATVAPRQTIGSTPYAIRSLSAATADNAQQLNGISANQFVQTNDSRLTDGRNPLPNSPNYIQNSAVQQTSANFNISGSGAVGGIFSANQINIGAPTANSMLGVYHSGNNGILVRGTSGYSYVDIDSPTGDSNFRLARAGVLRWTIRNVPADDSLQFYSDGGGGERMRIQLSNGNVGINNQSPQGKLHISDNGGNIVFGNGGCNGGFAAMGFGATLTCTNYSMLGEGFNTVINRPTGGVINFRENNVTQMTINAGGTLTLNTLGAAGSTQLCRNASNQISTCSSSLRYKTNIAPFTGGLNLISQLNPITFNWKDGGAADLGFGAEDVAKVEPLLTITNAEGEVEGVKYDRITAALVNAVREQQAQIEAQQKLIRDQQQQITELQRVVYRRRPAVKPRRRTGTNK